MKIHELDDKCPFCGHAVTNASSFSHAKRPSPGDYSKCIECGAWSVFTRSLKLRKPTPDELAEIAAMPEAAMMEVAHSKVKGEDRRRQ